MSLFVVADDPRLNEIIVLSGLAKTAPVLSCRAGPARYPKGSYLGQPLLCHAGTAR